MLVIILMFDTSSLYVLVIILMFDSSSLFVLVIILMLETSSLYVLVIILMSLQTLVCCINWQEELTVAGKTEHSLLRHVFNEAKCSLVCYKWWSTQ